MVSGHCDGFQVAWTRDPTFTSPMWTQTHTHTHSARRRASSKATQAKFVSRAMWSGGPAGEKWGVLRDGNSWWEAQSILIWRGRQDGSKRGRLIKHGIKGVCVCMCLCVFLEDYWWVIAKKKLGVCVHVATTHLKTFCILHSIWEHFWGPCAQFKAVRKSVIISADKSSKGIFKNIFTTLHTQHTHKKGGFEN